MTLPPPSGACNVMSGRTALCSAGLHHLSLTSAHIFVFYENRLKKNGDFRQNCCFYTAVLLFLCQNTEYKSIASSVSDFKVGKYTFEVGGRNKGKKQIAGTADAFVVRDDMEYGTGNVVPLWAFGLIC